MAREVAAIENIDRDADAVVHPPSRWSSAPRKRNENPNTWEGGPKGPPFCF